MGFMSIKLRKFQLSKIEHYEAKRDPEFMYNVLNDATMALVGFFISHLISVDYIYKHRQYVIERMHLERSMNFDRDNFDIEAAQRYEAMHLEKIDKRYLK